ncbi:SusE domain-containing protein [Sphingobacterium sp. GVS05A]|uniref:SusE domain-containing protein n=1 Tax=Sphingobacterium sp. GVS05A TaxID=2862679 RepID=UPI001CBBBB4C|nr:SusE domain-containing protein [Sphingobacterium sp. GVS05A]
MKIIHYIGLVLLLLATFQSCKKDETQARLASTDAVKPATLTLDKTNLTLSKANANDTVLHLRMIQPDFGFQAAVTNVLQFGLKGDNFKTVKEVVIPNGRSAMGFTGYELNSYLLSLGVPTGTASEFDVRLKSSINSKIAAVFSALASLKAVPYASTSYLYVPGAYQGWDPATAESIVSPTSNGVYTGIISFPEANSEFKLTTERNWANSYGQTATGKIAYNSGDNIKAPRAGNLEIEVNTTANTIIFKDHSWGVIGSATPKGWDADTDMKYDNANQLWKLRVNLTAGAIKFRKNHDWGTNFGGSNGNLVAGGADIAVANAGTYDIVLDLNANTYTLTKK